MTIRIEFALSHTHKGTDLIVRPYAETTHDGAFGIVWMMRFGDGAANNTTHRSVELDRRHVLIHLAHPDPIGRVERQVIQTKQELTIAGFRDRFFFKT